MLQYLYKQYEDVAKVKYKSRLICNRKTVVLKVGFTYMMHIEQPNIEVVEHSEDATLGTYDAEPVESGYAPTLGHSHRRILLSSLPGAAVTSVQMDRAPHEYSTIDRVIEDVPTIILHLKQ